VRENNLYVHNGESWAIEHVPIFSEAEFRQKVITACSGGARLLNLFGCSFAQGEIKIFAVLGEDQEGKMLVISMRVVPERLFFRSMTPELPQAHMFEREIAEQYGVIPEGHPWMKPLRVHNYSGDPAVDAYPFYQTQGEQAHEIAVGPVHAGIIEPGHFRFQCLGEEIMHLEIRLGYQHRGIEKMLEQHTRERCLLIAESIAGDTAVGHASAWCGIVESLSDCIVSPRAEAIRAIALELERLANHTGDLGALCGDIGFLPSAAYFGRLRGVFLNLTAELCGNRLGRSICCPGGVVFDLDQVMIEHFLRELRVARKDLNEIARLMFNTSSVLSRLEGIGTVSRKAAVELGLVGPTARASGLEIDARMGYASGLYRFHHIPMAIALSGDVYARALIRWIESQRSIDFLLDALAVMPQGKIKIDSSAVLKPNCMAVSMVEGWRGEIMHVAITDENSCLKRYKIKDPSFHNWPALGLSVRGAQVSDFPLCNKSFNLSYAGHDL
jgi:Ni,Fe-hydrogenase III large subunit/Ni,Fe-hydrogenase III component G